MRCSTTRLPARLALVACSLVTVACGHEAASVEGAATVPSTTVASTSPVPSTIDTAAGITTADGPGSATPGTVAAVTSSAVAGSPADRVPTTIAGTCGEIAGAISTRTGATTQLVIVRTAAWTDTTATLEVATPSGFGPSGSGWVCSAPMTARVGRQGLRPLLDRRSGDDTTPAGVFPLGTMTAWDGQVFSFFGNAPDPGVAAGMYRRVRAGDCFGATPNTAGYGHLRRDTACPGPDDEYLPSIGAYTNAALIGANMEPDVSGDAPGETPYAAAIFLHRFTYANPGATSGDTKATSGCVSLAQPDLTAVLLQLRADVRFAIGTTDWLRATATTVTTT